MPPVAVFVELVAVAVGGEPCPVSVVVLGCGWKQSVKVRVALAKRDFVEETKHSYVTSKFGWSKVVVEKSVVGREVDGV